MLREKCIRKALFHLFTRTKAHWKQIDPEGSTRVLSCIKIFLLKSLAVGEAMRLWSVCQAVKSSIQKPGADNFAAVFFWPALLSMVGFGSLYFGGVWEYFADAYPGNAFCMKVLSGASGACLSPCHGHENPLCQWAFGRAVCGSHGQPETQQSCSWSTVQHSCKNSSLSSV